MQTLLSKIAFGIILLSTIGAEAQIPSPADIVVLKAYTSASHAAPGKSIDIAVSVNIRKGWHINSNRPISDFAIPTQVEFEKSKQFRVIETVYPSHKIKKFQFSDEPMTVFEDTLFIGFRLEMANSADQDTVKVAGTLTYQACNDEVCLFPVEKNVGINIPVLAGEAPKKKYPEVFSQIPFSKKLK